MYKAIVVDDEKLIRDGITKFINSVDIGITVVASLPDGKDALEYLADNDVDIVIADIRMTHISGLELAKYIFENIPETKVVIISGFREFEYAQTAISYNVKKYLLKPTRADEITATLLEIKSELDQAESLMKRSKQYEELIPHLKEEFINDILVGGLTDEGEIQRKIELLNLSSDLHEMPCLIIEVLLKNYTRQKYGKDGVQNFLANLFIDPGGRSDFFKISVNDHSARFCAIAKQKQTGQEFAEEEKIHFEKIKKQICNMAAVDCDISICSVFDTLRDASQDCVLFASEERFTEQSKILLTHIMACHKKESIGIINSIYSGLNHSSINSVQEYLLKLFDNLFERLQQNVDSKISVDDPKFNYKLMLTFDNKNAIIEHLLNVVENAIEHLACSENDASGQILDVAIKYINENYSKDISLADVASKVYLNPIYFSRFFKKNTGENFSDYLVRVKMTNAVELLKKRYKLEKVSRLSGYNSSGYFCKVFKAYYGCNPKEYVRKNLFKDEDDGE